MRIWNTEFDRENAECECGTQKCRNMGTKVIAMLTSNLFRTIIYPILSKNHQIVVILI